MADIIGRYLQGEVAEGAAQERAQEQSTRRLAQTKLMLDLIRSNARLKNEDARDLSRLHELEPQEGERLLSSVFQNNPDNFPQVYQAYSNAQSQKFATEERIGMQDIRALAQQEILGRRRELMTPSEDEYQAIYGSRYSEFGDVPPLAGRTYPEIERDLQGRTSAKNATTAANDKQTPRPSPVDQPIDPEIVADAAEQYGVPVPASVKTFRQFTAWSKAQTKQKPEPTLSPSQSIEKVDEVEDYLFKRAQPKGKVDKQGFLDFDEDVKALMAEVSARAVRRGGGNANAVAWEILEKAGWKSGMKGKDARKILDSLGPDVTPEEKADRIRKALRGERSN